MLNLYLFHKNEVYTERLVEFRIDGPDYYLTTSHESYWAKDYIVIRIHKVVNFKLIHFIMKKGGSDMDIQ